MREHVRHGLDIIGTSPWLADAVQVVGSHHERFDGSGYPAGLAGEAIPLVARIFAVADVFDALTSKRPYKEPFAYEAAMALLRRDRGRHFDPVVLDAFSTIAQALHQTYAGRDHQGLRDELQAVLARVFSRGEIVLD
jgi:HD-GYP domain-containing protein (c-di-GMP phosphodiesterase class II)